MAGYTEDRLLNLVKRLNLASKRNSIEWSETDREVAYISILADAQILVASVDDDGVPPYVVEIISDDGTVVDSVRSDVSPAFSSEISELYERARRSATKADAILDKLLEALPELPGFSDEPPF